jgi:hypothetical protein
MLQFFDARPASLAAGVRYHNRGQREYQTYSQAAPPDGQQVASSRQGKTRGLSNS